MKRGDRVRVVFTGVLESKPIVFPSGESLLRVKVDGKKGWVAIVPPDKAKVIEPVPSE